jgi:hypothetical protein
MHQSFILSQYFRAQLRRLDLSISFVTECDKNAEVNWMDGEVGGFECYIAQDKETENTAAEVFKTDDDGPALLSIPPSHNVISIVLRDPGTMRFVKYLSASAPSSRYDIAAEFEIFDKHGETATNQTG